MANPTTFIPGNVTIEGDLTLQGELHDTDLEINLDPLYIDKANDAVFIGATAQADAETFYVKVGDDGLAVASESNTSVIIENSWVNYLAFHNPDANRAGIRFNDGTTAIGGGLFYTASTNLMEFYTGAARVGVFDSATFCVGAAAQADAETLYIKAGDDGLAVGAAAQVNLILEDDGDNYISFRQPTANSAGLYFNTGTTVNANYMFYYYNGGNEQFVFGLNSANRFTIYETNVQLPSSTDAARGAAGTAGRVFFNTDDGNLNIDDGTNWILPDGSTT